MGLNVAKWQSGDVATENAHPGRYWREVIFEGRKLRIRASKITSLQNSSNSCWKSRLSENRVMLAWILSSVSDFDEFFIKIGPIGGAKFGNARKMLYLCTRKQEAGGRSPGVVGRKVSNTM